jgi:hypothetical protein
VALAESVLQVTGKAVFFDASKNPMVIRQLAHRSDIELRVVHLVRDVRGASLSKRKNQGEMNWCQAVNSWVRMNRNIERQLLRIPRDRWIRIRYEDLCRDPAGTLDRFLGFCGLPARVMPGNFGSHEHHIVGNRMRLTNVADISLDEGWRRSLTPSELADAWALAGLLNSRYGYPPMRTSDLIS